MFEQPESRDAKIEMADLVANHDLYSALFVEKEEVENGWIPHVHFYILADDPLTSQAVLAEMAKFLAAILKSTTTNESPN